LPRLASRKQPQQSFTRSISFGQSNTIFALGKQVHNGRACTASITDGRGPPQQDNREGPNRSAKPEGNALPPVTEALHRPKRVQLHFGGRACTGNAAPPWRGSPEGVLSSAPGAGCSRDPADGGTRCRQYTRVQARGPTWHGRLPPWSFTGPAKGGMPRLRSHMRPK
jgi:hypothetical protein